MFWFFRFSLNVIRKVISESIYTYCLAIQIICFFLNTYYFFSGFCLERKKKCKKKEIKISLSWIRIFHYSLVLVQKSSENLLWFGNLRSTIFDHLLKGKLIAAATSTGALYDWKKISFNFEKTKLSKYKSWKIIKLWPKNLTKNEEENTLFNLL